MDSLKDKLNYLAGENVDNLTDPEIVKLSQERDIEVVREMKELNKPKEIILYKIVHGDGKLVGSTHNLVADRLTDDEINKIEIMSQEIVQMFKSALTREG